MKAKRIIPIVILIFIYIIAIKDTITLYHISGAEFSIFVSYLKPELLPFVALFELLILFFPVALSTIVTLYKSYKQSPPLKLPFNDIVMISVSPPILAIINNYISGIFIYSAFILFYSFIMTALASWTFFAGEEYLNPSKTDLENKKIELENKRMIEGLITFIIEIDSFRLPVIMGIGPYSLKIRLTSLSKQEQKYLFARRNQEIYQKIQEKIDPFLQEGIYSNLINPDPNEYFLRYSLRFNRNYQRMINLKNDSHYKRFRFTQIDSGFSFISYIAISLFVIIILAKFMSLYVNINQNNLFILIISSFILIYLFFTFISTRRRRIAGEKYKNDLRLVVQDLIDYGIKLIKENDLDLDLSIKLRHNDYRGLIYEKNGKNEYVACFEN